MKYFQIGCRFTVSGRATNADGVEKIEVPMMLQYAEDDLGRNATREDYGKALEMTNKKFVMHTLGEPLVRISWINQFRRYTLTIPKAANAMTSEM